MPSFDVNCPSATDVKQIDPGGALAEQPRKVLAVDDDPANLRTLRRMLEHMGFCVRTARSSAEAIDLFTADRPDLVLLDVLMPGVDGIETGRRIKAMSVGEFVPIIYLTALSDEDTMMSCVRAGGDDFLTKPLSFDLLKARIMVTERFRDLQRAMAASSEPLAELLEREHQEQQLAERVFTRAIRTRNLESDRLRVMQRSAATFGGDLILSQQLPDGGLRVLIADITGHGLGATIGALPVSEAFHAMTRKGVGDLVVLEEINRKLSAFLPSDRFMAACMVTIAGNGRRLTWWNGGMPSGWLKTRYELKELASHALPLGVLPELAPGDAPRALSVEDGDGLLLLTDGLLEAKNEGGEPYGLTRLRPHLVSWQHGRSLFACLRDSWESHCGETPRSDDVALMELTIAPTSLGAPARKVEQTGAGGWSWSVELEPERLKHIGAVGPLLKPLGLLDGLEAQAATLERILTTLCKARLADARAPMSVHRSKLEIRHDSLPEGGRLSVHLADGECSGDSGRPSESPASARERRASELVQLMCLKDFCETLSYDDDGRVNGAVYRW